MPWSFLLAAPLLLGATPALASEGASYTPAVPWVAPFVIMLLCIAILPLVAEEWWEHNKNKLIVSIVLGAPVLVLFALNQPSALWHVFLEYVSFVALLGALFIISGGILVTGDLRATPLNNTIIMAIGGLLASFMGTTGAAMVLIRPLLKSNTDRAHKKHTVIFFIFIVCNCGGLLTPLGDPPLFLGYLRGVPFTWTFHLWVEWAFVVGALLLIYFIWDSILYGKMQPERAILDRMHEEPVRIRGLGLNGPLLLGVIASVAFLGAEKFLWHRVLIMVALSAISMWRTPQYIRKGNHFNFVPINEVAVLFAGIFLTMIPALHLLDHYGPELGVQTNVQFFWTTGLLSSFLDNAPTYVTFLELAQSLPAHANTLHLAHGGHVDADLLVAISLGAVFMGANSYIGNAPNFMVKSIAESEKVKMPSFGGYLVYSTVILLPLFALVTFIFLK